MLIEIKLNSWLVDWLWSLFFSTKRYLFTFESKHQIYSDNNISLLSTLTSQSFKNYLSKNETRSRWLAGRKNRFFRWSRSRMWCLNTTVPCRKNSNIIFLCFVKNGKEKSSCTCFEKDKPQLLQSIHVTWVLPVYGF